MKKWILILTLMAGATPAWSQSTLVLPEDFESTPSSPQSSGEQMKPLDPAVMDLPEPDVSSPKETTSPRITSPRVATPTPTNTKQKSYDSLTDKEKAAHDLFFGSGTSSHRPVPPAEIPQHRPTPPRDHVTDTWVQALRLCIPNGVVKVRLVQCPSYAAPGILTALQNRSSQAGLREFDEVTGSQWGSYRSLRTHKIYGTLKTDLAQRLGVEAAACWTVETQGTLCAIGDRSQVIRWIRGG